MFLFSWKRSRYREFLEVANDRISRELALFGILKSCDDSMLSRFMNSIKHHKRSRRQKTRRIKREIGRRWRTTTVLRGVTARLLAKERVAIIWEQKAPSAGTGEGDTTGKRPSM